MVETETKAKKSRAKKKEEPNIELNNLLRKVMSKAHGKELTDEEIIKNIGK